MHVRRWLVISPQATQRNKNINMILPFNNYSLSSGKSLMLSPPFLLFILIACFLIQGNALQPTKDNNEIPKHYHTVEITSLFPASVCSSSNSGFNKRKSTLEVTHLHGPCSPVGRENAGAATASVSHEILARDQARVDALQSRINPKSSSSDQTKDKRSQANNLNEKKGTLPVQSGRPLGSGNYIVNVGLGTPTKTLSLVFDTGSDLTWTQCKPCVRSCYQQKDPIFDPSTSSSYLNVSCNSNECAQLVSATGINPGCSTATCIYGIKYGDQSFSVGLFSKDKLTLGASEEFTNFIFGCGQNNQGLFGNTAGILGLARNPLSLVSQTAQKYGKYFSYCLPPTSSSTGYLSLGKSQSSSRAQFTPFSSSRSTTLYFIDIVSISVGGRTLPINQYVFTYGGSIIDSGTVITRLPPAAYAAVRDEFRKRMAQYTSTPAFSILDTCYDFTNITTITIPTIVFAFGGNVKVDLDPTGILVGIGNSRLCLAFAGNNQPGSVGIFGNTQQKTFEVVYDVAGGKLGFVPGGCQ